MAVAKKTKAGEATQAGQPINEAKTLQLIHMMNPEAKQKATTLRDGVTFLLAENDRLKRQVAAVPAAGDGGSNAAILAEVGKVLAEIRQLKEQFSVMRQYGVGAGR